METLNVFDQNGEALALNTVKLGEEYSFVMTAGKVSVEASFRYDNSMLDYFVDVNARNYFYDTVLCAVAQDITGGVDSTHFAPAADCTRTQIVTFLYRSDQAK